MNADELLAIDELGARDRIKKLLEIEQRITSRIESTDEVRSQTEKQNEVVRANLTRLKTEEEAAKGRIADFEAQAERLKSAIQARKQFLEIQGGEIRQMLQRKSALLEEEIVMRKRIDVARETLRFVRKMVVTLMGQRDRFQNEIEQMRIQQKHEIHSHRELLEDLQSGIAAIDLREDKLEEREKGIVHREEVLKLREDDFQILVERLEPEFVKIYGDMRKGVNAHVFNKDYGVLHPQE